MRKLVHEEVDREIANKSVNIAIKMLKPELDQLMKGLSKAVQAPVKAAGKAAVNKIHPTTGKQSVKTLIRQGQGVSSIPLADEGLKDFQKIAKKYGVDFAVVKDKEASPPVYTVFFKAKDVDVMTAAFKEYTGVSLKKEQRQSIRKKLEQAKERVAKHREITKEKTKDRGQVR